LRAPAILLRSQDKPTLPGLSAIGIIIQAGVTF